MPIHSRIGTLESLMFTLVTTYTTISASPMHAKTFAALLLGLNGTGIIAHGRSDALAIEKAVEVAAKYAEKGVFKNVNERLAAIKDEPAEAK